MNENGLDLDPDDEYEAFMLSERLRGSLGHGRPNDLRLSEGDVQAAAAARCCGGTSRAGTHLECEESAAKARISDDLGGPGATEVDLRGHVTQWSGVGAENAAGSDEGGRAAGDTGAFGQVGPVGPVRPAVPAGLAVARALGVRYADLIQTIVMARQWPRVPSNFSDARGQQEHAITELAVGGQFAFEELQLIGACFDGFDADSHRAFASSVLERIGRFVLPQMTYMNEYASQSARFLRATDGVSRRPIGVDLSGRPRGELGRSFAYNIFECVRLVGSILDDLPKLREPGPEHYCCDAYDCSERSNREQIAAVENQARYLSSLVADIGATVRHLAMLNDSSLAPIFFDMHERVQERARSLLDVRHRPSGGDTGAESVRQEVVTCSACEAAYSGMFVDVDPDLSPRAAVPTAEVLGDDSAAAAGVDLDWLPRLDDLVEPPLDEEPPRETDTTPVDPYERLLRQRADALTWEHNPHELGETHAAVYASALDEISKDLDKARSEMAYLDAIGAVLKQMDEPSRLDFLVGAHHEAMDRLASKIRLAERILARPTGESRWATAPPGGWPTYADVAARRHNGNRWIVPFDQRYPTQPNLTLPNIS